MCVADVVLPTVPSFSARHPASDPPCWALWLGARSLPAQGESQYNKSIYRLPPLCRQNACSDNRRFIATTVLEFCLFIGRIYIQRTVYICAHLVFPIYIFSFCWCFNIGVDLDSVRCVDLSSQCAVWQPLVPQGTGPEMNARLGVVPHHLQPKDPRVRMSTQPVTYWLCGWLQMTVFFFYCTDSHDHLAMNAPRHGALVGAGKSAKDKHSHKEWNVLTKMVYDSVLF